MEDALEQLADDNQGARGTLQPSLSASELPKEITLLSGLEILSLRGVVIRGGDLTDVLGGLPHIRNISLVGPSPADSITSSSGSSIGENGGGPSGVLPLSSNNLSSLVHLELHNMPRLRTADTASYWERGSLQALRNLTLSEFPRAKKRFWLHLGNKPLIDVDHDARDERVWGRAAGRIRSNITRNLCASIPFYLFVSINMAAIKMDSRQSKGVVPSVLSGLFTTHAVVVVVTVGSR